MKAWLSFLLPHKLEVDTREPLMLFELFGDKYGVYAPSIVFWVEFVWIAVLLGAISALLSLVTYKFIIQKRGSLAAYVMGFGVVLPFWLIAPFYLILAMDIRNKVLKVFVGILAALPVFRTTEALYGFEPRHTSQSARSYALYWGSPGMIVYEPKSRKLVSGTRIDVLSHLRRFGLGLILTGMLFSYAAPYHFHPFSQPDGAWYAVRRVFDYGQLGNNLVATFIVNMYLTTVCDGFSAVSILIFGYKIERVMDDPLFQSKSPSDFWGRRWNSLIHQLLKRGAYLPVRKFFSKTSAVVGAFLASGLFHEWVQNGCMLLPMDYELDIYGVCSPPRCFKPIPGASMAFFLWNGLLVTLEGLIGHLGLFQWISKNFPVPIRAFLVVLLAVPVSHWFHDVYVKSSFLEQGKMGFPMIVPVRTG